MISYYQRFVYKIFLTMASSVRIYSEGIKNRREKNKNVLIVIRYKCWFVLISILFCRLTAKRKREIKKNKIVKRDFQIFSVESAELGEFHLWSRCTAPSLFRHFNDRPATQECRWIYRGTHYRRKSAAYKCTTVVAGGVLRTGFA